MTYQMLFSWKNKHIVKCCQSELKISVAREKIFVGIAEIFDCSNGCVCSCYKRKEVTLPARCRPFIFMLSVKTLMTLQELSLFLQY